MSASLNLGASGINGFFQSSGLGMRGDSGKLTFSSGSNATSGVDTGVSRGGVGIVAIGTGAAGNAGGSIAALSVTLSGATQTFSNAAFTTCTALTTVANVLTCTVSDRRVKDISGPLVLRDFDAMPQRYTFKTGTPWADGREHISLIAQDVRKAYPECAPIGGNGLYQVDTACVVAVHQGEIRSLKAENAALRDTVTRLRAANDNFGQRLGRLERAAMPKTAQK